MQQLTSVLIYWIYKIQRYHDVVEVEKILQIHPDLAGKLAEAKQLTHESAEEQKTAGLHNISSEEKTKLDQLNKQ